MTDNGDSRVKEQILKFVFNNEDFEANVKQSIMSLGNLRMSVDEAMKSINGKSFDGLTKAAEEISKSTAGIDKNIFVISERFSSMGLIGTTVLTELTKKALNFGLSLGRKVLSPLNSIFSIVKNKGWSRATNEKQAEFMIKNLGLSWEEASKDIQAAVLDTRFGFDEAATAAAQLATSGVKFGKDMPDVLKAIGNAASMTNSEFGDMAHVFTTMASNGRVYGVQLQQMSVRGINATKALADYLGKTESQIRDMVTDGKVSFTDFYKAINEAFGDAAFKANETFTGVLANNKAVFARIGKVYASGFMDAARDVLNVTLPKLKEFEKTIKPIGETAAAAMGAVARFLIPIIKKIDFTPIKNFIDKYVTPLKNRIEGLVKPINEVSETMSKTLLPAEELVKMANKVIRGDYGNGKKRRDELEALGLSYEQIQNKVNELLGCSFRYKVEVEEATETTKVANDAYTEQARRLDKLNRRFKIVKNLQKFVDGMKKFVDLGKYVGQTLYDTIYTRFINALPKLIGKVAEFLGKIGEGVGKVIDWAINFDVLGKAINGFFDILGVGRGILKAVYSPIKRVVTAITETQQFKDYIENLKEAGENFYNFITSIGSKVTDFYNKIKDLSGIKRLVDIFDRIVGWFEKRATEFSEFVFGAFNSIFDFKILKKKTNWFGEDGVINGIANWLADGLEAIEKVIKGTGGILTGVTDFIGKLINAVVQKLPNVHPFNNPLASIIETIRGAKSSLTGNAANGFEKFFNILKIVGSDFVDNTPFVKQFVDLFKAIKTLATGNTVSLLDKLLEFIDKTFGTKLSEGDGFINMFGEGGVVDTASKIVGKLVEALEKAPGAAQNFFSQIQNAVGTFVQNTDIINNVKSVLSTLYTEMGKGLPSFFKYLTKNITQFFGDALTSIFKEKTPAPFQELFGEKLNQGLGAFADFVGWLLRGEDAAKKAKSSLKDVAATAGEVTESFDFLEKIKEYAPYVGQIASELLKNLGRFKDWGLDDLFNVLKSAAIIKILFKTGDAIASFSHVLDNAGGITQSFAEGVAAFKEIPASISGAFTSFSELAKNWSNVEGVFKQWRKKPLTTAIRDFAIAVALVAASIALLGSDFVNYDRIRENSDLLMEFALIMGGFVTALALCPPETVNSLAAAFISLGGGLFLLTAAIALLGRMDRGVLEQGGLAVVAFMTFMAIAAQIASANGTVAARSFLAMSVALFLLVPAIHLLGTMDPNVLAQGGVAVVKFMLWMALATKIAASSGKVASLAFLSIAVALNLLVPAVFLFGKMNTDTLLKGGAAIVAFMTFMALAAKIAGGSGGWAAVTFLAMAVAINLLVPALLLVSTIKTSKLMAGVVAISVAINAIAYAVMTASMFKGGIAAAVVLAGVTYLIGFALIELASFPMSRILAAATALTMVFLAITFAFKILEKMDWKKLAASAGAMALTISVFAASLGLLAYFTNGGEILTDAIALGAIILAVTAAIKLLGKVNPADALKAAAAIDIVMILVGGLIVVGALIADKFDGLAEKLNKFGLTIHAFFEGLNGRELGAQAAETEKAGGSLSNFADKITNFLEMLDDVDDKKAANAKNLADAIWSLTKTELVQAISNFLGIEADFSTFGSSMEAYATAFFGFVDLVDQHDLPNDEKLAAITSATSDWIDLAKKLEPNKGLFPAIAGITDLGRFGEQMNAFANGFYNFCRTVNMLGDDLNPDKIRDVYDCTTPMIDIAKKIDNNKGILVDFFGISDLGVFGTQLRVFGEGFKEFNTSVAGITTVETDKIKDLSSALQPMIELAQSVVRSKGWIQSFIGEKDLGSFGTGLSDLADSVVQFNEKTAEVNVQRVHSLANALNAIGALNGKGTDIFVFTDSLSKLGEAIGVYNTYAVDFNPENLKTAIGALEELRDFFTTLSGIDEGATTTFVNAFKDLGQTSANAFANSFAEAVGSVVASVNQFLVGVANQIKTSAHIGDAGKVSASNYGVGFNNGYSTVVAVINQFVSKLIARLVWYGRMYKTAGINAAKLYAAGITAGASVAKTAASRMGSNAADAAKAYQKFYDSGKNAAIGFKDGINDYADRAISRARQMAADAKAAVDSELDENSPSKELFQRGAFFSIGFANGIDDKANLSTTAASNMARDALVTTMAIVSQLASIIDQNLDVEPTIRPVLDTSGVEYGMSRVNSIMSETPHPVSDMIRSASAIQNEQTAVKFAMANRDYSGQFASLLDSNSELIAAVKENRYAIIDGEYVFDFVDRRMGMA